jgi:hypothetical protein
MSLVLTQPPTEMSIRNLPGVKGSWRVSLTSPPFMKRLHRKYDNLDVSQSYRPPQPVTGIVLPLISKGSLLQPACEVLRTSRLVEICLQFSLHLHNVVLNSAKGKLGFYFF